MSTALETRQQTTLMLASVLDGINQLDEARRELVGMLPHLEDEEIIQARMGARAIGVWSWVIECACDAEILKRVEAKRGRGNKDVEETGRIAAVNKHAYQCGQQPATIYRNAQIYKTFKNTLIDQNNLLEEKGFYEAALRAPDPKEAIEMFASTKDGNAFFSVKEAHREAEKLKRKQEEKSRPKLSPELQSLHDQAVREDLDLTIAAIRERDKTPADPLLSTLNRLVIERLEWQRDRTIDGDIAKIVEAVDDGCWTGQDIFDWLHTHLCVMSDEQFDDRIEQAIEKGKIDYSKQGGKGERARGDRTAMYVLHGARSGDAYSDPRSNSIYSQGESD